jgi:hypothetical protein
MHQSIDLTSRVLRETAGSLSLRDQAAIRSACSLMAAQAKRELRIFSRDLDAALYDHEDFLQSVRRLALHNAHSPIEILLIDTKPAVHKGHRLIGLSRQTPSRIQIRCMPAEFHDHREAYLIVDEEGYVLRPLAQVFTGQADFFSPRRVRLLRNEFEHIWERSTQSIEFIAFGRGL